MNCEPAAVLHAAAQCFPSSLNQTTGATVESLPGTFFPAISRNQAVCCGLGLTAVTMRALAGAKLGRPSAARSHGLPLIWSSVVPPGSWVDVTRCLLSPVNCGAPPCQGAGFPSTINVHRPDRF